MLFKLPNLAWKWDEGEREWSVRTAFGPAVVREDDESTWGAFCEDWGDEAVEFATVAGLATEDDAKDCVQRWYDGRLKEYLGPATEEDLENELYGKEPMDGLRRDAKKNAERMVKSIMDGSYGDSPSDRT